MKRFIQKTTSVFMSLAMTALIGAPAYATTAENKFEQTEPGIVESVLPDIASEKSTLAVAIQNEAETDIPPVCDHGEEEAEMPEETEKKESETAEESNAEDTKNNIAATPTDPVISEEDILDYIQSEEVQDALEDAGVDTEELEESIENGEMEFIEVPEDELPENLKDLNLFELYGASVLTVVMYGADYLTNGLLLIALAPLGLVLWVIPPIGAAYMIAGIPMGIAYTLGGAALFIISPVAGAIMTAVIKSE